MKEHLVFKNPVYVTRPVLPSLHKVMGRMEEIWASQWLTNNGAQHALFERRLVELLNVPYLSLFNNGTIALITACQSMLLAGEAITTPFTFPATPHVLTWNNVRPVFCDINPVTLNIDADKIEALITPRTTGILAVHVYGMPCELVKIQTLADRYGLKVIYDAAHAFGAEVGGVGIGNFGDITMFSFHATKLFHTAEGGALAFRDQNLKARIELLKNFGIKNEEEVVMPGINGKMNELQAALGLVMLDYVESEWERRKQLQRLYYCYLQNVEGITLPVEPGNLKSSYQYFVIRVDEKCFGRSRDDVYDQFKTYNVFTRKYFYPLCSEYACYRHLPSASPANLPVASQVAKEVLCLPFYGGLHETDIEQICEILLSMRP